jgi:hypothetical protein
MGAVVSAVRRGELLTLLYGRRGERGGRMGEGIGRSVVAASLPVVRFGGEGKWRGEWGVKRGECDAVSGRGGDAGWCMRALAVAPVAAPSVSQGGRSWAGPTRQ